jgi:hypothetical protein
MIDRQAAGLGEDIKRWLDEAEASGAKHMLVVCNTADWSYYPVNIMAGQNLYDEIERHRKMSDRQVIGAYSAT